MNYVVIVAGQSNAVGRALNPVHGGAAGYIYARTKIWITNTSETGGLDTGPPFTPATTWGWQLLDPTTVQSYEQGPMLSAATTHGIEPWLAYLFETDPLHAEDTLYIVKHSYGGIPLAQLTTGANQMDFSPLSTGKMYRSLVDDYLIRALASSELAGGFTPLGHIWLQGENDALVAAMANAYAINIDNFFATLAVDIPQLATFPKFITSCEGLAFWDQLIYADIVRGAQEDFCAFPANNATLIDTDTLARRNQDGLLVHYSNQGYYELANSIYPLFMPIVTIDSIIAGVISGQRATGSTVVVACLTATVGAVSYPTSTTWSAAISGLAVGDNVFTATVGGVSIEATYTVDPTAVFGIKTLRETVTFSLIPTLDLSVAAPVFKLPDGTYHKFNVIPAVGNEQNVILMRVADGFVRFI